MDEKSLDMMLSATDPRKAKKSPGGAGSGRGAPNRKRQAKNAKFGFSGGTPNRKRGGVGGPAKKRATPDASGPRGGKGGKGGKAAAARPGKRRRQNARS